MACTNKLLKDKAALKSKMIEVILVNKAGVIDEYSGIASNNEISPIKSIQCNVVYGQRESNSRKLLGR